MWNDDDNTCVTDEYSREEKNEKGSKNNIENQKEALLRRKITS
jgi:hypothetical protein